MNSTRGSIRLYSGGILLSAIALGAAAVLSFGPKDAGVGSFSDSARRAVIAVAARGPSHRRLLVHGEVRPSTTVTLYAKIGGYLQTIYVDKGDRVQANQVIAVIESPEIDWKRRAALAEASHKRATATGALALGGEALPHQRVQSELVAAGMAEANLEEINIQKEYSVLRAPFGGMITARFADAGALVQSAAIVQKGALPVVTVSDVDRVRIFAYLDQTIASAVRVGDMAEVILPDRPMVYPGTVLRMGGALDPKTRSLSAEIKLDSQERSILPGSFVRIRLTVATQPLVEIPVDALILRAQKPYVAAVSRDNRVELREVAIGHFEPPTVGLVSGLSVGSRVARSVGSSVRSGDVISPVTEPPREH